MTAAARYIDHMRTLWPRWTEEPFRDYADDGAGGEPGLESQLGGWRDGYLSSHFPQEYERGLNASWDEGTFRLGGGRLRILLYLFCPFVYGRDWGSLNADRRREPPRPLPPVSPQADQERRVAAFLGHMDALESHFASLSGAADAPPFHDPALLVAISLHEGGVTTALASTDHTRVGDPSRLSAHLPPDDETALDAVLAYIQSQRNLHSFYDHGLDHLGAQIAQFRRWGWIPAAYDGAGGAHTWLYEPITPGPVPASIFPGEARRRARLAACYPGNAYDNYHYAENKCFNAAVLPRGDIFVGLALTLWRLARQADEAFQEPDLFPGERLASLPAFMRRLIMLFAFGSSSFIRPARVRRDAVLRRRVARLSRRGRVADQSASYITVGALLKFLKESAGSRTAAVTAADPTFYTELYAQFAFSHSVPRNRFWRAYVADLLERADVLRAPPPSP